MSLLTEYLATAGPLGEAKDWVVQAVAGGDQHQARGNAADDDRRFRMEREPADLASGERQTAFRFESGEGDFADMVMLVSVEASWDPYHVDLTGAVFIAGALHVIHNTARDLPGCLLYWNTWLQQLTHLSRLLSRTWPKARLLMFLGDAAECSSGIDLIVPGAGVHWALGCSCPLGFGGVEDRASHQVRVVARQVPAQLHNPRRQEGRRACGQDRVSA